MHIRRFEGPDMRDVLKQVREELGPDALVLSTRSVKKGAGPFGTFSRDVVEVTAAVDREAAEPAPSGEPSASARPDPSWDELRLTRALVSPLEREIQTLRDAVDRLYAESDASATRRLSEEVAALRSLALDLRSNSQPPAEEALPFPGTGLAARHARELAALGSGDEQGADRALARLLEDALSPPRPDDDGVTLYVGPPGVGKTTTLAKVASRTLERRGDLAVFSTDVHRVAAEAPLRAWTRSAGIPFEAGSSPVSVARAASKLGKRPILVDTVGRGRRDPEAMGELLRLRDALGDRARVCLVLPATRKEADLRADLAHFATLEPGSMAVTHVDESNDLGNVANLLLDGSCPPLHWISTGQRVPDDIDIADPDDLAKRILGAAA